MDSPTVLRVDRPQALELRKTTLESNGHCVGTASSGYSVLQILKGTPVSAILLEYRPEGKDAEAVACQIKQQFPSRPIILLPMFSESPERILWLVDEYVMKRCRSSNKQRHRTGLTTTVGVVGQQPNLRAYQSRSSLLAVVPVRTVL